MSLLRRELGRGHSGPAANRRTRTGRRFAFTMIELLLALFVSAVVLTAVAGMLLAVSYGTSSQRDMRGVLAKCRIVDARLSAAIRSSRAVLASGNDYVVLWMADTRANGQPNLSEIRLIERDSAANRLESRRADFPDHWTESQIAAADTAYVLAGDFRAITNAAKTTAYFPAEPWGTGIPTLSITTSSTGPSGATLATYQFTVQEGAVSEQVSGAACTRR